MKNRILFIATCSSCFTFTGMAQEEERPNFVWFMTEDVAPQFMGLYNHGKGAQTPNVEALAQEGITFQNAYSNAPVSSAARSTLITGCYAPRLGISFHRKLEEVPLPNDLHMFPAYLRQAGYHTSNAAKTDYNCFLDTTAWNVVQGKMGEWRNRSNKKQPFFFVRTNGTSHESCLHFNEQTFREKPTKHDPNAVRLLPLHPDTKLFRYTYATFYDKIQKADEELGQLVNMLREDGELDNTFIFYFGDNGGSLPGSKGYTYETGLQVPLVIYIPKKWRDKIPMPKNSKANGFVSFIDFGPTLLHLAGIDVPKQLDGKPFLGKDITPTKLDKRDVVFGYGDRFDELYAFNRTVRKGNFKYSRNFSPYHSKSLYALYRYKQLAFQEWKNLYNEGKLNETQARFFEPQGAEELYDLSVDPNETHNLAADPHFQQSLKEMRSLLFDHMIEKNDLGILPECVWFTEGNQAPSAYGQQHHKRLVQALATANLQLDNFHQAQHNAIKSLQSKDPAIRYWALTACIHWGKEAASLLPTVKAQMKKETNPFVRSRAQVFYAITEGINPVEGMKHILSQARTNAECLQILNDMAFLKEYNLDWKWNIQSENIPQKSMNTDWRMEYLNE